MSYLTACPTSASLGAIPIDDCPENMGQIQKIIFQRVYSTGSTKNSFTIASANPNVLASWTPLLSAADGTKVVQSPYVTSPENEPGESMEYGGGNETLGGIPITLGLRHTSFTANVLSTRQDTIEAMKTYRGEKSAAYLVDEHGRIWGLADDVVTPTMFYPIPIHTLSVADRKIGGFEAPDMNGLSFNLAANWSDKLVAITPTDFDALTQLSA